MNCICVFRFILRNEIQKSMFTVCSETALKLQDQLDETQYGRLTLNFVETS